MKFKVALAVMLSVVMLLSCSLPLAAALPETMEPMYNNTLKTTTIFSLSGTSTATVEASYRGVNGITTGATITVKVQRLVGYMWADVLGATWSDSVTGYNGSVFHSVTLSEAGEYRAIVTYTVSGTGGSPDVITETEELTY